MSEIDFNAIPGTLTERFVSAKPFDTNQLALVFKRAYKISPNGSCMVMDEPLPLLDDLSAWEEDRPQPLASPPSWDIDLYAFKPATDIVVQGHAYTYSPKPTIDAEVKIGTVTRTVRVHGDRRVEWSAGGPVFSSPELFDKIPIRYDYAYGGVDLVALAREGDPIAKAFQAAQPRFADIVARSTEFHYPRNPSGCGYLITADQESIEAVKVPNLEFPFDPITPDRLQVGKTTAWLKAPLPAGFDWYHPAWFPRIAYMGLVPEIEPGITDVSEAAQGWIPPDILTLSGGRFPFFDHRFQQGASPGLSIRDLPIDAEIMLRNIFPESPEKRIRLPGVLPKVKITLKSSEQRDTLTRVTAVIVQPDVERVIIVYSAGCEVERRYANHEMAEMKWSIE